MCHPVGYKEAFMPKIFFSFQLIHEWLSISVPKVYRLGLFFSWLDGSKYILSVKVAWSILDLELKAHFLTSLEVDVLKWCLGFKEFHSFFFSICDAFRDLVPFVQFKTLENTHGGVLLSVKLQVKSLQLY